MRVLIFIAAWLLLLIPGATLLSADENPRANETEVAPVEPVVSVDSFLDSVEVTSESWAYMGNGAFMAFRSCRVIHIQPRLNDALLDMGDSSLYLSGSVYDSFAPARDSLCGVQMLVGRFTYTSVPGQIPTAEIVVRERFVADSAGRFDFRFKVKPDDILCFTGPEADSTGFAPTWGVSAVYAVGRLLE